MVYLHKCYSTFFLFLMMGCGLSSSAEKCRLFGSKSAPGMVARARSSAANSMGISILRFLASARSRSILARLLSAYRKPFSPCVNIKHNHSVQKFIRFFHHIFPKAQVAGCKHDCLEPHEKLCCLLFLDGFHSPQGGSSILR